MKCTFTYHKVDHSENVEEHCQDLMNKLTKYLDRPLEGNFTFSMEKYEHKVCLTVTGKGMYFKSEAKNENFYAAIEDATDKIHRQLEKKKSKMKNHKQKHPAKEMNNLIVMDDYREIMALRRKIG